MTTPKTPLPSQPSASSLGFTRLLNFSTEIDGTPVSAFALSSDPARALELTAIFETIWGLKRLGYNVPIWMSQGSGEVLAKIELKSDQIVVGDLDDYGQSLPWTQFFAVGEGSRLYREAGNQLREYLTQASGLMHWVLLEDGDAQKRFSDLALRLRTMSAADAVQAVMNAKDSDFQKRIDLHLKRTPTRKFVYHSPTVLAGFQISPAPETEVLVATGELLIAGNHLVEGNARLDLSHRKSTRKACPN